MEYALENKTLLIVLVWYAEFGMQCNTADCYRALYLFTCHQYDEVMSLCETILHDPELQCDITNLTLTSVLLVRQRALVVQACLFVCLTIKWAEIIVELLIKTQNTFNQNAS